MGEEVRGQRLEVRKGNPPLSLASALGWEYIESAMQDVFPNL
jgi:hypothetical protein